MFSKIPKAAFHFVPPFLSSSGAPKTWTFSPEPLSPETIESRAKVAQRQREARKRSHDEKSEILKGEVSAAAKEKLVKDAQLKTEAERRAKEAQRKREARNRSHDKKSEILKGDGNPGAGEKSYVGATELDTKCVGAGQYRRKKAPIEEVESYMIYQI